MINTVTVACCQLAPKFGNVTYNKQLAEQAIREAASNGANIIVLPELIQSGYVFNDKEEAALLAETVKQTPSEWAQLAQQLNVVIVGGFCERGENNQLHISAALATNKGDLILYRKVHLWNAEKRIFTAGCKPPPVIDTRFGKIAVMICYDQEFPEWVRLAALAGADLIAMPVNWPDSARPDNERPMEIVRVQANAAVNRLFIAACDRAGAERGVHWVGGSVIVDTDGYPLTPLLRNKTQAIEGIIYANIEINQARQKAISELNNVHKDRKPELYSGLL